MSTEHYVRLIAESGLFDEAWYTKRHRATSASPILQYVRFGARAGFNPNPCFDTNWYLSKNPDVAASKINPLVHYIRHGAAEGRSPYPQFDTVWYLKNNPDVAASGMNPLAHYLMRGVLEKRSPRPQFDISLPPAPDQDALQAESIERRARTGATSEPYRLSEGTPDLFELRS